MSFTIDDNENLTPTLRTPNANRQGVRRRVLPQRQDTLLGALCSAVPGKNLTQLVAGRRDPGHHAVATDIRQTRQSPSRASQQLTSSYRLLGNDDPYAKRHHTAPYLRRWPLEPSNVLLRTHAQAVLSASMRQARILCLVFRRGKTDQERERKREREKEKEKEKKEREREREREIIIRKQQ